MASPYGPGGWFGRPGGEARTLRAGAVALKLVDGELRYLTVGGLEVLRRVAFCLRAGDWDTPPPAITKMEVRHGR
jgi:hypothetical protein